MIAYYPHLIICFSVIFHGLCYQLKEIAKEEEDLRKLSDEKGSAQMLYPEQTETACNSIQKM